jgi:hypothetical protein
MHLWERVLEATGGGHPSFLMGEISTEGWWHYFPVAFAIKTPLPTLIVLLGACGISIKRLLDVRRGKKRGHRYAFVDALVPLLFVVLYGAATVVSRLNIGYRHLLPILPPLYIFAARVFVQARLSAQCTRCKWRWAIRGSGALLGFWLIVGTLKIWPFHLAFFNALIGGPDQGYRYLVDSNTDWGQALKALHSYIEREHLSHVRLSTYIEYGAAFAAYGLADIEPLPPLHAAPGMLPARFNPAPGVYVISTTTLQGIFTADPEMYDWFRNREPDARIGHVMFLYKVPPSGGGEGTSVGDLVQREGRESERWIAQCTVPVAPLSTAAIAEGFGHTDFRRVYFDCTQSWHIPAGGQRPGWYVFFRDIVPHETGGLLGLVGRLGPHEAQKAVRSSSRDFIGVHVDPYRLSFEQTRHTLVPPFAIYETQGPSLAPTIPVSASIQVGRLMFLGHTVVADGAEVWTYWRVAGPLPDRPLSLMLHLVVPESGRVIVGDGLGVPIESWQVGDVMIQRHTLSLAADAQCPCEMYTGAYWLDTLERWSVWIDQVAVGDRVPLSP